MKNLEEKKIYMNKLYVVLMILFFIALLICGMFVLTLDAEFIDAAPKKRPPEWIWMCGALIIIICLPMMISLIKKLLVDSPGLVLEQNGVWLPKFGMVPWRDIEEVKSSKSQTNVILIYLKEPNKYISTGNIIQRYKNQDWFKNCGTPVVISTLLLNIRHDILLDVVKKYYNNSVVEI